MPSAQAHLDLGLVIQPHLRAEPSSVDGPVKDVPLAENFANNSVISLPARVLLDQGLSIHTFKLHSFLLGALLWYLQLLDDW